MVSLQTTINMPSDICCTGWQMKAASGEGQVRGKGDKTGGTGEGLGDGTGG